MLKQPGRTGHHYGFDYDQTQVKSSWSQTPSPVPFSLVLNSQTGEWSSYNDYHSAIGQKQFLSSKFNFTWVVLRTGFSDVGYLVEHEDIRSISARRGNLGFSKDVLFGLKLVSDMYRSLDIKRTGNFPITQMSKSIFLTKCRKNVRKIAFQQEKLKTHLSDCLLAHLYLYKIWMGTLHTTAILLLLLLIIKIII